MPFEALVAAGTNQTNAQEQPSGDVLASPEKKRKISMGNNKNG